MFTTSSSASSAERLGVKLRAAVCGRPSGRLRPTVRSTRRLSRPRVDHPRPRDCYSRGRLKRLLVGLLQGRDVAHRQNDRIRPPLLTSIGVAFETRKPATLDKEKAARTVLGAREHELGVATDQT